MRSRRGDRGFSEKQRRIKSKRMKLRTLLVFPFFFLATSGAALADCADFGEPGVDWRRCILDRQDLRNLDLTGANLRSARFARADLSGSNLKNVDGFTAHFVSAILKGVTFDGARLSESDFTKADLEGASMVNADLRRARFFRANLRGVNLTGAKLRAANFLNADLTGATWIDGKKICGEGSLGKCF